ncbi:hypothetical protein DAPPUDRAFT_273548 [Daphnia pulex]|uniref:Uncharacterized protein n=1 Tax=Daphnia pulex TaxID=6669 RepID=E9I3K7_DAPPU|nr:hypothetical protein DAPPUDRAFT_273548 [Daphnia pulex]|eukprot:EFX61423.1 hypothetical protein DAPPUDRAFT_273548 [Daphnia pulex]
MWNKAANDRDRFHQQEHRDKWKDNPAAALGHCGAIAFQKFDPQLPQRCSYGTRLPSAESIPKWVDFIREAGKKDIKVYIIGNKCDLEN